MLKVAALRDVDVKDLRAVDSLPDPLSRRARHVVTENARVLAAVEALTAGDLTEVGRLFRASHASMRDDFDVSVPAIDSLVESTSSRDGVYGARLTGGGFGGALVAVTRSGTARAIGTAVIAEHNRRFPDPATVVVPTADNRAPGSGIRDPHPDRVTD
jgi:galactokinase